MCHHALTRVYDILTYNMVHTRTYNTQVIACLKATECPISKALINLLKHVVHNNDSLDAGDEAWGQVTEYIHSHL